MDYKCNNYLSCLQAMMAFAMQLLSGQNLIGQGVQFFVRAGMSAEAALDVNLALNSVSIYHLQRCYIQSHSNDVR